MYSLGLPGNPPSAYENSRDKALSRSSLEEKGVPTVKSFGISSVNDVEACIEKLGFPVIVKPTAGGGSLGVYIAYKTSLTELMKKGHF